MDNGDVFDPFSRGSIEYDSMDLSAAASQQYMLDFCQYTTDWSLTPQSQMNNTLSGYNICTMYWFKSWMEHSCPATNSSTTPTGYPLLYQPQRTTCCNKIESGKAWSEMR